MREKKVSEVRESKYEGKAISFNELVDVRKEEMQSMLPNFMAEVRMGDKTAIVKSPSWYEKVSTKVRGEK